jgi:glycosyltransferase involved in cell wall biosynthesis
MVNTSPRYSIIIPTYERGNLLQETIAGCLLQDYDDFEILVSNNFSGDNTDTVLSKYANNPKIRIIKTEKKLSMQDHWAFAMTHTRGDYILFLGDDDCVSPMLFKIIDKVIELSSANIIKFKTGLYYHNDWSGIDRNTLHFNSKSTGGIFNVDIDQVIRSFCNFSDYKYFPSLLASVFRRDLYLSAKKVVDHMFVGAPDHSFAFLIMAQANARLSYVDMVLGYGGRSENSNAAFYMPKEGNSANKKKKHTEWSSEMTDETRLPHHQPQINTPGNFLPAAFSYAKFFYPERLSAFNLNCEELCKIIQRDLVNCIMGRCPAWHSSRELTNFYEFVKAHLNEKETVSVFRVGDKRSILGRIRLLVRRVYFYISNTLTNFHIFNIELHRARIAQRRAYDKRLDLSSLGISTARELTASFDKLVFSHTSSSGCLELELTRQSVSQVGCIVMTEADFRIMPKSH